MAIEESYPMYPYINTVPLGLTRPKARPAHAKFPRHLGVVIGGQSNLTEADAMPFGVIATAGVQRAIETLDFCVQRRIDQVTLYVFPGNVQTAAANAGTNVLALFVHHLKGVVRTLSGWRVRLRVAGDLSVLPVSLAHSIRQAVVQTCCNTGLTLTLSIDGAPPYAFTKSLRNGQGTGSANPAHSLRRDSGLPFALATPFADPDFIIRTGGRIPSGKNMVWDTSKTALYFTEACWSHFDTLALARALHWFSLDERPCGVQV